MTTEKHFSTILGLVFLLICIAAGIFLTRSRLILGSKASGDCRPINPQVANITNTSADISYLTSAACPATISVNNQIFDDVKSSSSTKVHYFQVKYLSATTAYHYIIISNGQNYDQDSFHFTSASNPQTPLPTSNLAWGRVLNPDKNTAGNAIVYLNIPGASPLSSFITTDGNWSISLASSFNDAQNDWFTPSATAADEEIIVISEDNITTQVINSTSLNNPVPDIIIGQNSLSAPVAASSVNSGTLANLTPVKSSPILDILNPIDGETLNSAHPEFFGTAPINSKVVIEVHSDSVTNADTQSDATGSWNWSPTGDLAPGNHTVTVKVQDPSTGTWQSITRTFTVLAADNSSLAFVASGSATPKVTSIPSPSVAISTPTSMPTSIATITPTPIVRAAHLSTASSTPVTGNTLPTVAIITVALLFFIISVKFI
jgi:hypothetical protein